MVQRVFGAVRAAGNQVIERSGAQPIQGGELGWAAYLGVLERGPTNELIGPIRNLGDLQKKTGERLNGYGLPANCRDYLEVANGAGGLFLQRITDGNEAKAGGYWTFAHTAKKSNLYARNSTRTTIGTVTEKTGGRAGGKEAKYTAELSASNKLLAISLDTELTVFQTNEWTGGYIELDEIPGTQYSIVSNTAAGLITVDADQDMAADLAAAGDPTNLNYYLVLADDANKGLDIEIRDGEQNPDTEFGIFVYIDGRLINQWPNLSMLTTSGRYWETLINDDPNNDEITVTDTFTGSRTASSRPSNSYGISGTLTATQLDAVIHEFLITSAGGGDPTVALATTTDTFLEQVITITMSSPTAGAVVSDRFGALGTITLGTAFDSTAGAGTGGGSNLNKWVPTFTLTAGATALAALDVLVLTYKPFKPNELTGGYVYPDKVNEKRLRFRILSNDHDSIVVDVGSDLTNGAAIAAGAAFLVTYPQRLEGGRDGNADLSDSDYTTGWNTLTSPFNQMAIYRPDLVKLSTPGNTATAVQKAGVAYASANNHQYRYEVPANIVTESAAIAYLDDTLGRNDYAVGTWPSFAYIPDENSTDGLLKLQSISGMIHGREARVAADSFGYHQPAAGEQAFLPKIVKLTTGDRVLDEEILNPRGISVVKKVNGNFVLWGARTLAVSAEWTFKHHRELTSYYEHVLLRSFGFITFGLNNQGRRNRVLGSAQSFFQPEWRKGALDNDIPFEEAAIIKADIQNNPPEVRAMGDMVLELSLRYPDIAERLRIFVSKAGVFEDVSA